MAKVSVYNQEGNKAGDIELNDNVFFVTPVMNLIHQVYVAITANARQPWAHTKLKSEVRGGGKKPWKQKGTGRARHGSIRSPIWKGGGVTFGPRNIKNFTKQINAKMKKRAVNMALSAKVKDEKFVILDTIETQGKTKELSALRNVLPGAGRSTLLLVGEKKTNIERAIRNIQKFDIKPAIDVNVVDLLNHQYIIATKNAVDVLQTRLG